MRSPLDFLTHIPAEYWRGGGFLLFLAALERYFSRDHPHVGPTRRSPVAHWRHYTAGPVLDNPARRRVQVPDIGLCVRIRVHPRDGHGDARATP